MYLSFNKSDNVEKVISASTAREVKLLAENVTLNPADLELWKMPNVKNHV